MSLVRMDIETVVVGGGPISSLVVLRSRSKTKGDPGSKLPIRIGAVEASSIGMGVDHSELPRPMTHDLLANCLSLLGAKLNHVTITKVEGTTFFAQLDLVDMHGIPRSLDARPSDAIALALRTNAPIFADKHVVDTASYPDYDAVEKTQQKEELEAFHEFLEGISPEDFHL